MGLVQFCSKFIPDLSTVAEPIQKLVRKNVKFSWGNDQQTSFEEIKKRMTSAETLAYFHNDCKTRVITDASPMH
jgi:hypothetical protein